MHAPHSRSAGRPDIMEAWATSLAWMLTGVAVGLAAVIVVVGSGIVSLDSQKAPAVSASIGDSPLVSRSALVDARLSANTDRAPKGRR